MSLTTLAAVKTDLGIVGSSEDARLTSILRGVCWIVRSQCPSYCFGGVISAISIAAAAVVTAIGHGLNTGDKIVIANSNCTPTIDGERTVTVLTADTFSVPVTTTVAGTAGNYGLKLTEFYAGNDAAELLLRQRPVQSIEAIYEDQLAAYGFAGGAFASNTALAEGTDYALICEQSGLSLSGIVLRIGGLWPGASEQLRGIIAQGRTKAAGNIKVVATYGFPVVPFDVVSAVHQIVAEQRRSLDTGGPLQSESFDYYSYSRMSSAEQSKVIGSAKAILAQYNPLIF